MINGRVFSFEIALKWLPMDVIDKKLTSGIRRPTITWTHADQGAWLYILSSGQNELSKLISVIFFTQN